MKVEKELSREDLLRKVKSMTVYILIYWGLSIFIIDGSLYSVCSDIGHEFSFDGRYLFATIGAVYYVVFIALAIVYGRLVMRYNFPGKTNKGGC